MDFLSAVSLMCTTFLGNIITLSLFMLSILSTYHSNYEVLITKYTYSFNNNKKSYNVVYHIFGKFAFLCYLLCVILKDGHVACKTQICHRNCTHPTPDPCCPICDNCMFDTVKYMNGERFNPDPCKTCECKVNIDFSRDKFQRFPKKKLEVENKYLI